MAKKKPIIIYGRILSPFVARCAIAAQAKGMAWEIQLPPGGLKSDAFRKISPFAKIPAIKDGAMTLCESGVIVDYIEAKSRAKRLLPAGAKAVAQVRLLSAIAAEYVQPPGVDLFRLKRGTAPGPVNVEAATAALEKSLTVLEQTMPKGKYACGAKVTLADCYVAPALSFAVRVAGLYGLGDPFATRPKLGKYWKGALKDKTLSPILAAMSAMADDALAGRLPPMH